MKIGGNPPVRIDFLPFQLSVLSDLINELADPIHKKILAVSVRELRVLRLIHAEPGINSSSVLLKCALEKTTLSKLIGKLVKRGYVSRTINAYDARYMNLCLTSAGVDVVVRADKFSAKWVENFLCVLNKEEIALLEVCLNKLQTHALNAKQLESAQQ